MSTPETVADAVAVDEPQDAGRETAADRRARPSFGEIARSAAERVGVCVRPLVMQTVDTDTGLVDYVPVPCKSTVESECPSCATKARAVRIQQCREGWHLDEEPVQEPNAPTDQQQALLRVRADMIAAYHAARDDDNREEVAELAELLAENADELRACGLRGTVPSPDARAMKVRKRSTRRRQDAPNLPRRTVAKATIGREYAGKFRPSMFVTLTLDSYGRVKDSAPVDPGSYDYRRAARDVVGFSSLVDRWIQNLRRVIGWEIQYFATVEPQKRGAPHLHIALRGSVPHAVIRQVTEATYHQVWWPHHDRLVYPGDELPVWDHDTRTFIDPQTRESLTGWDDALDQLADDDDAVPAHVVRFGAQVDSKGVLGGTPESGRHVGYLTKYLTKSISEVIEPDSTRSRAHHDRLHAELGITPCSPRCPVWLRYGIVPKGATSRTVPGRCKGKAHRRATLGLPGRRVLVSRKWTGKTLPDHRADREQFVRQLLADIGIQKPDRANVLIRAVQPGDPHAPGRDQLILRAVAQRLTWQAEYDRATVAAAETPPGEETSATQSAA